MNFQRLIAFMGAATAAAALAFTSAPHAESAPTGSTEQTFEVAMDGNTFFFEGATNAAGAPANGTPFVIQGYIYPDGVFDTHGDLSGVNPDGSPEFPNLVVGTWICRGWHLQDGDAATGPVVATTQIFDFGPEAGRETIITDGIELADFDLPFTRAITGATGRLADFDDRFTTCEQVYVGGGLNVTGGFNTEFTFRR
jgi:hypothetical protein